MNRPQPCRSRAAPGWRLWSGVGVALLLALAGLVDLVWLVPAAPSVAEVGGAPPLTFADLVPLARSAARFWLWATATQLVLSVVAWRYYRHSWRKRRRLRQPLSLGPPPPAVLVLPTYVCLVLALSCLTGIGSRGTAVPDAGVRWAWGGGLVAMTLVASVILGWRKTRRVAADSALCPACLGVGGLTTAPEPDSELLICRRRVQRWQEEECGFAFPSRYAPFPKLRFPVLGIAGAGKTLWLATVYLQLRRQITPPHLRLDCLVDTGETWDTILDIFLNHFAANVPLIPDPSVRFMVRDDDRWGRSSALVSTVDPSGDFLVDAADRTARYSFTNGAGHLLLLDVSQPAENQLNLLAAFIQDFHASRALAVGSPLNSPIAVVLSKLDLLAMNVCPSLPTDDVTRLFKQLQHLDDTDAASSLAAIRYRSALLRDLLPVLWPGWNLVKMIEQQFGHPAVLFPLSSIGLDGAGNPDFRQRIIRPYGVLEPLLWLLHMNGYQIFRH